jgi:hypothetical protein
MMTPLELVCSKLGIAIDARETKCPAHDDVKASLSVNEGDDGRVLLCCHAGCSFEEIILGSGDCGMSCTRPGDLRRCHTPRRVRPRAAVRQVSMALMTRRCGEERYIPNWRRKAPP